MHFRYKSLIRYVICNFFFNHSVDCLFTSIEESLKNDELEPNVSPHLFKIQNVGNR